MQKDIGHFTDAGRIVVTGGKIEDWYLEDRGLVLSHCVNRAFTKKISCLASIRGLLTFLILSYFRLV